MIKDEKTKKLKNVLDFCIGIQYNKLSNSDKLLQVKIILNGILAQLGEHLPYKQRVTGSSPVGPIINENDL